MRIEVFAKKWRMTKLINNSIDPDFIKEADFIKNELRDVCYLENGIYHHYTNIYRKNQVISLILKKQGILDQVCPTCKRKLKYG